MPNSDGSYDRQETPRSPKWVERFGNTRYPRRLHPSAYPFLAAIEHGLGEVPMVDLAGVRVNVRVETMNTGYGDHDALGQAPAPSLATPDPRPAGQRLSSQAPLAARLYNRRLWDSTVKDW